MAAKKQKAKKELTLEQYRQAEYQKLGFTEYESRRLAEVPGLDVGSVRRLLDQKCSLKLAYRIFRP